MFKLDRRYKRSKSPNKKEYRKSSTTLNPVAVAMRPAKSPGLSMDRSNRGSSTVGRLLGVQDGAVAILSHCLRE